MVHNFDQYRRLNEVCGFFIVFCVVLLYICHMEEKFGPCLEKKCSWCCNPVKMDRSFSNSDIPLNKKGDKIWIEREGLLVAEENIDGRKLKAFDCINYNPETGLCNDYKNRPEVCKNTTCIQNPENNPEDQHLRRQQLDS